MSVFLRLGILSMLRKKGNKRNLARCERCRGFSGAEKEKRMKKKKRSICACLGKAIAVPGTKPRQPGGKTQRWRGSLVPASGERKKIMQGKEGNCPIRESWAPLRSSLEGEPFKEKPGEKRGKGTLLRKNGDG